MFNRKVKAKLIVKVHIYYIMDDSNTQRKNRLKAIRLKLSTCRLGMKKSRHVWQGQAWEQVRIKKKSLRNSVPA